jgi:hypothetical protein
MVTGAVHAASRLSQPIEVPAKAAWRLMGAAITVAGLATIHALREVRPAAYHRGPVTVDPRRVGRRQGRASAMQINGSERWS